jgi:O-acetyl-ADP-ribose deacetylase (regulator of RNase III)
MAPERHERAFGEGTLRLQRADITALAVDAVVNAANSALAGGGGVDGAIHRAGGPAIMRELRELHVGGCPTGSAVMTHGGELPARYVIHAVGPRWRDGRHGEPALLRSAYRTAFQLAADHDCESVAAPSISTGIYGFPVSAAAPIALEEARAALQQPDTPVREVIFALFSDADLAVFAEALAGL